MTSLERIQFTAPTQADWERASKLNRAMARRGLFWDWKFFGFTCRYRAIFRRRAAFAQNALGCPRTISGVLPYPGLEFVVPGKRLLQSVDSRSVPRLYYGPWS